MVGDGQRKKKEEEPKNSDRSIEIKRTQQSNYNENKTENYNVEKRAEGHKK